MNESRPRPNKAPPSPTCWEGFGDRACHRRFGTAWKPPGQVKSGEQSAMTNGLRLDATQSLAFANRLPMKRRPPRASCHAREPAGLRASGADASGSLPGMVSGSPPELRQWAAARPPVLGILKALGRHRHRPAIPAQPSNRKSSNCSSLAHAACLHVGSPENVQLQQAMLVYQKLHWPQ